MYFGRLEFRGIRRRRFGNNIGGIREWSERERESILWGEDVWNFWSWRKERKNWSHWLYLFFFWSLGKVENGKLMKLSKNWLFIFWEGGGGEGELLKRGLLKFRPQFCDITRGNFDELRNLTKGKLMNLSGYYRILYSEINEWHYVIDNLHISVCATSKLYNLCKFYEIVRTVNFCVFRIPGI